MARKKYTWGGHTYLIADEDLKLYPGAVPVEEEKKAKKSSKSIKEELAVEQEKEPEEKAAEEPKNKARKNVKNKAKVEE